RLPAGALLVPLMLGGALVTGVLLMRRQALLGVLPWRSHWLVA
ncbi:MviN family membrane protein, partial [Pseudomonas savastanoi pv. glycinea str. race 4]